jgi:hypothetical protein
MHYRPIMLLVVVGAGLLLAGASPKRQAVVSPGKPQAPVNIEGFLDASHASVLITFEVAATEVTVRVYGTDGLVVQGSATPVTNGTFAAGETLDLAVDYTPGPEQSNLTVVVSGQFGGRQSARVTSFTVGNETLPSKRRSDITYNEKGEPIIVMPAEHQ